MSQKTDTIEHGMFYHIYNRGINAENLFREKENYLYFLKLYDKYVAPVADTFAWVLMPNHFHFLVRIKEKDEMIIDSNNPDRVDKNPSKYFSDLFNSYTQSINKKFNRHGNLFERPFKRIHIVDEIYCKNLVIYIHNNPIKHGFVDKITDYDWTSFKSILSDKHTKIQRVQVIDWFEDRMNFEFCHRKGEDIDLIKQFILE